MDLLWMSVLCSVITVAVPLGMLRMHEHSSEQASVWGYDGLAVLSIDMQMIECSWSLKLVQSYTHMFKYHCCTIKQAEKYCDCLFKLYRDPQLKDSFNVCWWLSTLLIVTESKFAFLWFKCCKLFSESPTRSPFKLIDVYYSLLWRNEVQQGDMFPSTSTLANTLANNLCSLQPYFPKQTVRGRVCFLFCFDSPQPWIK